MRDLSLAGRLAWRSVKAGEYRVLLAALILAVACATLLGVVGDRLQRALDQEAARMAGGDLVLSDRQPLPEPWAQQARSRGLSMTRIARFSSMAAHDDAMLLASVTAVDAHYPLLGSIDIQQKGQRRSVQSPPKPGEIWLEPGLALRLGVVPGDEVELGDKTLRFSAELLMAPDQGGGLSSLAPKLMVNLKSLEDSVLMGPLSRIRWRAGFTGSEQALADWRQWLTPQLSDNQRLLSLDDDRPGIGRALDYGRRYLGQAGLVAVLLASMAVALATHRQVRRQTSTVALLRALGVSRQRIRRLWLWQFAWVGVFAGLFGGLIGYAAQQGLVALLQPLLPITLPPPALWPLGTAILLALWILLGFALVPLLRLVSVSPLSVLQNRPLPQGFSSGWRYLLMAIVVLGLGYWLSGDARLTLWTLLGLGVAGVLVALFGWGVLWSLYQARNQFSWHWRQALRRLYHQRQATLLQLATFTLTFTALLLVARSGQQLLETWQMRFPEDRPDHFAIDIQPQEQSAFLQALNEAGIEHSDLYPVVRGRLSGINDEAAEDAVPASQRGSNTLRREWNLTWSAELPDHNRLSAGRWWQGAGVNAAGMPEASVEQGLADRLGLTLGDTLTFSIAGQSLKAQITSFRDLEWSSLNPNFYVILPPSVMQAYPHTFLGSFALPQQAEGLLRHLAQRFPGVAFLDIRALLTQAENLIGQLSLGIEYVLGFVVLAALLVTWALMMASLDARLKEQALLRVLGATWPKLRGRQNAEFCMLGLLSGGLASLIAEVLYSVLAEQMFGLTWSSAPIIWLIPPLAGAGLLMLLAYWALAPGRRQAPHQLLKQLK